MNNRNYLNQTNTERNFDNIFVSLTNLTRSINNLSSRVELLEEHNRLVSQLRRVQPDTPQVNPGRTMPRFAMPRGRTEPNNTYYRRLPNYVRQNNNYLDTPLESQRYIPPVPPLIPLSRTAPPSTYPQPHPHPQPHPQLPTSNINRNYDENGQLESVEFTFSNYITPENFSSMFSSGEQNTTNANSTNETENINNASNASNATTGGDYGQVSSNELFLNLLNRLNSSYPLTHAPTTQTYINTRQRALTISEINRYTTIDRYSSILEELQENSENTEQSGESNNEICAICRDSMNENNIVRRINICGHYFHNLCIDSWFELRNTCPNCRELVTQDVEQPRVNSTNNNINNTSENTRDNNDEDSDDESAGANANATGFNINYNTTSSNLDGVD